MAGGRAAGEPASRGTHARRLGVHGEDLVAAQYERLGYAVVERNWRDGRRGELDLVVSRGRLVVFCEVKARGSDVFGAPIEAVGPVKQQRLRRLAMAWLAQRDVHGVDIRFDVASVRGATVEIVDNAF